MFPLLKNLICMGLHAISAYDDGVETESFKKALRNQRSENNHTSD